MENSAGYIRWKFSQLTETMHHRYEKKTLQLSRCAYFLQACREVNVMPFVTSKQKPVNMCFMDKVLRYVLSESEEA